MKRKRQAVVVIHGIGEQRPMRTLRSFVTTLLNYEKHLINDHSGRRTFWTKPDRISNSYELRKISASGTPQKRSTTHFYEFHWADNMRDTRWRHILNWFGSLMRRSPSQSESLRLKLLWAGLWGGVLLWVVMASIFSYNWLVLKMDPFAALSTLQAIIVFIPLVLLLLHNIFIDFIGDAARYLRVDVENIHQRETIRRKGVDLLKALHETEDYDRIIVVGHSLGSVIAYDIITYLWIDFNKSINLSQKEDCLENSKSKWPFSFGLVQKESSELQQIEAFSKKAEEGPFKDEEVESFQTAQNKLWCKIQHERKSWLISDLVTLGSPLSHAKFLMADSDEDFALRIDEREYPVSPPLLDGDDLTYPSGDGHKYLHHATPFAVTRWTNLFYNGDFIAGKVGINFGPGIKDLLISYKGGWFNKLNSLINPFSHNRYWISNSDPKSIAEKKEIDAIKTLYDAMRLNDLECEVY